jgi:Fe2+ or Zn2+ uptake regulation protein
MHEELVDLRLTPQRRAVLDVLHHSDDHPNAAEVFERVRILAPGIGAATVYRSLAHLVAGGRALELTFGNGACRYDANLERHDHLICDSCGSIVDVPAGQIDNTDAPAAPAERARQLEASTGFEVTSYDLRFHGRCAPCRAESPEDIEHLYPPQR